MTSKDIPKGNVMIKALLIDLDGTLVDSTPALYKVYQKFLAHYGHKGSREEFNSLIGPSIDEIVEILKKNYSLKDTAHDLSLMYISLLMLQGFEGTELFPAVKETLILAKEKKLKLGIVTSGTKPLVNMCLNPFNIIDQFDIIVTAEDVSKGKPDPEIYQVALKKLGVKPGEAVAIEDSSNGLSAALGAGLKVLMVTHGKEIEKRKYDQNVVLVANWNEINSWIQSK